MQCTQKLDAYIVHMHIYFTLLYQYVHACVQLPERGDATVMKSGPLEKLTTVLRNRKWKSYTFKIVNQTHLKYFKSGVRHCNTVADVTSHIISMYTSCLLDYVFVVPLIILQKKKARGEIMLSTVTNVVIAPRPRREKFYFEVYFSGKDSPWTLATHSVVC